MLDIGKIRPDFLPQSIFRAITKHAWGIAFFWAVSTALVVAVVFNLPPTYTAEAVILVESQKIPETFVTATVQTTLEARLDLLKQQVLSHDRLWTLAEDLNLYPKDRATKPKEEVLRMMRDDIRISLARGWSARGPGAFQVEYRAPSAETAAEVANRVGNFFITENLRQRTGEAAGTSEFLDRELEVAEKQLRDYEAILKEYKLSHNGELPQQEGALLASMSQSRTELSGIQDSLGRAQQNKLILEGSASYAQALLREQQDTARRLNAAAADAAATPAVPEPQQPPAPPTELQRARAELRSVRARYFDTHPDVQRLTLEVERLEREEKTAHAQRVEPRAPAPSVTARRPVETASATAQNNSFRIEELQGQIALMAKEIETLENRRTRVLSEIADLQSRIRNLPVREQQLAAITRDYETCKANYDSLRHKKLAADVAFNMERWEKSQKFVMLDPARPPQKPARPQRTLLITFGGLLSLVLGASLAFLFEMKKNVFLGEWELPEGTVVLGRTPILPADAD